MTSLTFGQLLTYPRALGARLISVINVQSGVGLLKQHERDPLGLGKGPI